MKFFAVGGILGPASFFFGWLFLGLVLPDYNPVSTAISELARTGCITSTAMTVAFLGFSVGLTALAVAAQRYRKIVTALVVAIIGSTGVAGAPLGTADSAHFAFAALSYVALAALPLVGARQLGHAKSTVIGVAIAACLLFSVVGPDSVHGLFQRAGLTLADLWLIAFSARLLRTDSSD